ncbi:MAG: hypothetical protein AMDU2_EPLC00006G0622 [Thermoplasmatales archaeon E-plasma]|jgi:conserved hypothetical protein TIGR00297|nr:MAG: hypothetical protein AMDU2_EPLC00006G0622 [Thermoplasmatales archaeon E-plasma]
MFYTTTYILLSAIFLIILFVASQIFHIFDLKGGLVALVLGIIVDFAGYFTWLILLLIFALVSFAATRYRFAEKKMIKMQEGEKGERKIKNVFYAGIIGGAIAAFHLADPFLLRYFELFAISFAVVTADTFGSEIGVLDPNVIMITTLKRTQRGINGGISVLGEIAALFGALIIGLCYILLKIGDVSMIALLIITLFGFLGCQIDSVLGALLENKGKLSKGQVNFLSILFTVIIAIPFVF